MADLAAPSQPAAGLPPGSLLKLEQAPCSGCGAPEAPHRGELRTTRVAEGVVRDEYVHRCTTCLARHRSEGQLR